MRKSSLGPGPNESKWNGEPCQTAFYVTTAGLLRNPVENTFGTIWREKCDTDNPSSFQMFNSLLETNFYSESSSTSLSMSKKKTQTKKTLYITMLWDLKASCGKGTKNNNTENLASSASTQVFHSWTWLFRTTHSLNIIQCFTGFEMASTVRFLHILDQISRIPNVLVLVTGYSLVNLCSEW